MTIALSLSCTKDDLTAALFDGTVDVPGVSADLVPANTEAPGELFARQRAHQEFDVSEMSLSGHVMAVDRGDDSYVGIPVFLNRVFRHAFLTVREDSGIRDPAQLRGCRIGLPEFHMTVALYVRGFLADDYQVRPGDVTWVQAGRVEPGRKEREPLSLPDHIKLEVETDRTLEAMLAAGEIDAMISGAAASGSTGRRATTRCLFEDPRTVEVEYFRRTGIYPIMHIIVIRRSLVEKHPWLPMNVTMAFEQAKKSFYRRLRGSAKHHWCTLPLFNHFVEDTFATFGPDIHPYGLPANRSLLETVTRWSFEQGLSSRALEPEELFWWTTHGDLPRS